MENNSPLIFEKYKIISKIDEGSFGKIYKGIDTMTNKNVAIKIEKINEGSSNTSDTIKQLQKEASIYKIMETNNDDWPKVYSYGTIGKKKVILVMDLLGKNLEHILQNTLNKKFSPYTVAYIADKMITILEKFHKEGIIHRDLKPQNFVIGYNNTTFPEIYLIDYGLSRSIYESDSDSKKNQKFVHIPFVSGKYLIGTVRFTSIYNHLGMEQSRRDELQSLGYILIYFLIGKLPWQNVIKSTNKRKGYHDVMLSKMSYTIEKLTKDIEVQSIKDKFIDYFLYVNSLLFEQKPDYVYLRNLFKELKEQFTGEIQ